MAKQEPVKPIKSIKEDSSIDKIKEQSVNIAQNVAAGSIVVGQHIAKGAVLVGQGTVAAVKGAKTGVEKGVSGFKQFLSSTAEALHLKKPDWQPVEQFEKEVTPYLPTELIKHWMWKNVKLSPGIAKGNLVLKWTRVFCWRDDPFKPELLYPLDEFIIIDKEKKSILNHFLVKEEEFGTITGETGAGKTAFLHWIKEEIDSHHPEVVACFVDSEPKKITESILLKKLMLPFLNIYQKTVSRPFEDMKYEEVIQYIKEKTGKKPFVLLIDEPQNLTEKSLDILAALQKSGIKIQLIVAGQKEELKKSSIKGKDSLKFELEGIDTEHAIEILKKRIESVSGSGTYPFDHQSIKILRDHAKGNPLRILELAKEKAIQLSIDHQEEIVAQQQEMERQRIETVQQKIEEEKRKRIEQKEKLKQNRENERTKHFNAIERQRAEEERHYKQQLEKEDEQLNKIDDVIGLFIDKKETQKQKNTDNEIEKQEEVIKEATKTVSEEKKVKELFGEDPALAKELEQVFAETEKAKKAQKKK
ncbi:MAG: AAA family ATPase [Candidatus Woesearchaeota archaeon]